MVHIEASAPGPRTAHEYVKDSLRRAILAGAIPGGSRLVQKEVARDLRVSTTPVREALRDLATEGLIRLDPHHGAIVHHLSFEQAREIQGIRALLEPTALRQAATAITAETLAEAEALIEHMAEELDPRQWADLNREFHGVVTKDIPWQHLYEILRTLRDTAAMYVGVAIQQRPHQSVDANQEHRELVAALRAGDADGAAVVAGRHFGLTMRILEESRHLTAT